MVAVLDRQKGGGVLERQFIVTVLEEDLPDKFKDDLEGHIRGAIGDLLGFDADVGFSVEEINAMEDNAE